MKQRSKALLALAILAASPAAAAAAEPPLKTLPSQQDIWITGTIQRGHGQYAPGDYTTLRLDRPSTSPCNDKVVTDIVLGMAGVPEPLLLLPYLGPGLRSGDESSARVPTPSLRRRRTLYFRSIDSRCGTSGRYHVHVATGVFFLESAIISGTAIAG
jgi:hypothetical protein